MKNSKFILNWEIAIKTTRLVVEEREYKLTRFSFLLYIYVEVKSTIVQVQYSTVCVISYTVYLYTSYSSYYMMFFCIQYTLWLTFSSTLFSVRKFSQSKSIWFETKWFQKHTNNKQDLWFALCIGQTCLTTVQEIEDRRNRINQSNRDSRSGNEESNQSQWSINLQSEKQTFFLSPWAKYKNKKETTSISSSVRYHHNNNCW
jgi:hypothetical protein